MSLPLGASLVRDETLFAVRARDATKIDLCLFEGDHETIRVVMTRQVCRYSCRDRHGGETRELRYGFRAEGPWVPEQGSFLRCGEAVDGPLCQTD